MTFAHDVVTGRETNLVPRVYGKDMTKLIRLII